MVFLISKFENVYFLRKKSADDKKESMQNYHASKELKIKLCFDFQASTSEYKKKAKSHMDGTT